MNYEFTREHDKAQDLLKSVCSICDFSGSCVRRPCAPKVGQVVPPGCAPSSMACQERPIHSGVRTVALQAGWEDPSVLAWHETSDYPWSNVDWISL